MDVGHLYYRRVNLTLAEKSDLKVLAEAVADMQKEAERDMRGEGFSADQVASLLELFIQPTEGGPEVKQTTEVNFFEDPSQVKGVIQQVRELLVGAGHGSAGELMLTTVSLMAQARVPHYDITETPLETGNVEQAIKVSRPVFLDTTKGVQETAIYEMSRLKNGHQVSGPALIESEHTTVLIPSGWRLSVDKYNNAVLEEVS